MWLTKESAKYNTYINLRFVSKVEVSPKYYGGQDDVQVTLFYKNPEIGEPVPMKGFEVDRFIEELEKWKHR